MKAFNRLLITVILLATLIFAGVNLWMGSSAQSEGRQHRVDAARAAAVIEKEGMEALLLSDYPTLTAVFLIEGNEGITGGSSDYLIREINGRYYRFDYSESKGMEKNIITTVNLSLGVMAAIVIAVLLYLRRRVVKPFLTLREMPYELSKGNLTMPLKENRQRYFGRFIWGMDMLREKLEQNKETEMSLQAERKKLILSLSHDIKIPLSAIKLYSKALSKGLYEDTEKQAEIAESINEKADEIEGYVSGIVKASKEDFLSIEVQDGEFYLSEMLGGVTDFYKDKLRLLKTEFSVSDYSNCLIRGDCDRGTEVLQNIMENAIKYGDGKRISIDVTEEEGCRLVTVTNWGCTLPESELPHMFDSFWRGTNAADKNGSGLGLYICRCIMNKMHGEVFAQIKDGAMSVTAVFSPV